MDQTGVIPALTQNFLNAIFFAYRINPADKLNCKAVLLGDFLSVGPDLITQRFSKTRIIKDADAAGTKESRHPLGMTDTRQSALDDDTVITRQDAADLRLVTINKGWHGMLLFEGKHYTP